MKKQISTTLIVGLVITIHINIVHSITREIIEENAITRTQYNDLQQRLIISEALVKKCAENDTIDIMEYVREVKREIEVEFKKD